MGINNQWRAGGSWRSVSSWRHRNKYQWHHGGSYDQSINRWRISGVKRQKIGYRENRRGNGKRQSWRIGCGVSAIMWRK